MSESMNELNDALHQLQDELANLHGLLVLDRISNNSRGARPRQMRGGETHGT
jgi:ribosomal protein L29